MVVESASGKDAGLIGVEVNRSNTVNYSGWLLTRRRQVAPFDYVFTNVAPVEERRERRNTNRSHPRHGLEPLQGQAMKAVDLFRVAVADTGKNNSAGNEAFGFPSATAIAQFVERPDVKRGTGE